MKIFNPLHALLLCIALFASPLHAQTPAEKTLQTVQNGYHSFEQRITKLFRCLGGKGTCSPSDFAAVVVGAMMLYGILLRTIEIKAGGEQKYLSTPAGSGWIYFPSRAQEAIKYIDPAQWGYAIGKKYIKESVNK